MIEVLWHGRGGQGAFTAARLLGAAASLEGDTYALAFPSFGPERRGAPMKAFTKISKSAIGDRSAIKKADFVVYLDDTLFADGWEAELKSGARVLVNSQHTFADKRVTAIDANRISSEILGRPIPNTVFIGALCALVDTLELEDAKQAIRLYMPSKLHASNERIVEAAFAEMKARASEGTAQGEGAAYGKAAVSGEGVASATVSASPASGDTAQTDASADANEFLAVALLAHTPADRRPQEIPTLQDDELDPAVFARTTCYAAGHLVSTNAGWRNERPVVDAQACTGCLQCYLYCPDGCIFKVEPAEGTTCGIAIDYDFCKGCGMCVRACKFGALSMVSEPQAKAVEAAACAGTAAGATAGAGANAAAPSAASVFSKGQVNA